MNLLGAVVVLFASAAAFSAVLFFIPMSPAPTAVFLFLTGVSVSSLLPLLITLTGSLYRRMSGTALSIVKLGIPVGGILVPAVLSAVSRWISFRLSLGIFPVIALAGCILVSMARKRIQARIDQGGMAAAV
jgi:MFS family permease